MLRLRKYLTAQGVLDETREAEIIDVAEGVAAHVRSGLSQQETPDPAELFEYVYARSTPQLAAQAALLREEITR